MITAFQDGLGLLILAALAVGCGESHAPADAGMDANMGWDSGVWSCEGDAYRHQYVFDGVPGDTGCQRGLARMDRVGGLEEIVLAWGDPRVYETPELGGFPSPPICWVALNFKRLSLDSSPQVREGATGELDPTSEGSVYVGLSWDLSGNDPPCVGGTSGGFATSGTYRVLQGAEPGETFEVEVTNVTFRRHGPHTMTFPRLWWRTELIDNRD